MALALRVAAALLAASLAAPALAHDRDDDCKDGRALRLVNGRIHTMESKDRDRVVSSVVIRNGRFVDVGGHGGGGDDDCTKTINLHGRTAVPGIIDNHNHIVLLGLRPGHDTRLEFTRSIPEALATLNARADKVRAGEWITTIGGFSRNQWFPGDGPTRFPTLDELTVAVPKHPVFIMESFFGPGATNALGKAFLEKNGVAVGADGSIAAFAPSLQALFLLRQMQDRAQMLRSLQDAMTYAAGVGVTTHLDQGGFPAAGNNTDGAANFDRYRAYDALRVLYAEGKMTNRIWLNFLHLEEDQNTPELRARLLNVFNDFGDDMVRILGIGEFNAGPFNNFPITQQWMNANRLVAQAQWRNENHSLGGLLGGVPDWKLIIDGWQTVQNEELAAGRAGIGKLRWTLAHVPFIDDEYLQRLKGLGGGISVVGAWRWLTGTPTGNGPPFRTILASGIPTGMSSDGMQISVMSPWVNLYYVVTGKNARGQVINAGQTLGRYDALRLYTRENGWFLNAEDKMGTIEEGKFGDLVVLSGDYFDEKRVPDEKLKDLRSVLTVVNGKVVYDDLDGRNRDYWKAGLP
jgi:predicted amidohydrolase YtcJ